MKKATCSVCVEEAKKENDPEEFQYFMETHVKPGEYTCDRCDKFVCDEHSSAGKNEMTYCSKCVEYFEDCYGWAGDAKYKESVEEP